jgi:hypothetical protein
MLTMYLDESLEQDEGHAVVAGFVGDDAAWDRCILQWGITLARFGRTSLHMKELRGWNDEKHRDLLRSLGLIPAQSGLALAYASVKFSDYADLVRGTLIEVISEGYLSSLFNVVAMTIAGLPEDERLEVVWEQQSVYSGVREAVFSHAARMPDWETSDGVPRLAKWSSMAKSTILEPSDYACYALLQRLRDPLSRKSALCAPILANPRQYGFCMTRDQIRSWLTEFREANSDAFDPMTKEQKKEYRAAFRQAYRVENDGAANA